MKKAKLVVLVILLCLSVACSCNKNPDAVVDENDETEEVSNTKNCDEITNYRNVDTAPEKLIVYGDDNLISDKWN